MEVKCFLCEENCIADKKHLGRNKRIVEVETLSIHQTSLVVCSNRDGDESWYRDCYLVVTTWWQQRPATIKTAILVLLEFMPSHRNLLEDQSILPKDVILIVYVIGLRVSVNCTHYMNCGESWLRLLLPTMYMMSS